MTASQTVSKKMSKFEVPFTKKFQSTDSDKLCMYKELKSFSPSDIQDLNALMQGLSKTSSTTEDRVRNIIESTDSHLYVAIEDNHIIGCASLCIAHTPEMKLGFIEAVSVNNDYRGKGIGKGLMDYLLSEAGKMSPILLHLTSNPKRIAANGLYKKLGFKLKETNCYIFEL